MPFLIMAMLLALALLTARAVRAERRARQAARAERWWWATQEKIWGRTRPGGTDFLLWEQELGNRLVEKDPPI